MIDLIESSSPKSRVRSGTILFALCIAFAYAVYPHWVTLSHFAAQWYTLLPFVLAMLIAMAELWYVGSQLHRHSDLRVGANALYASAVCAGLLLLIPYMGKAYQKDAHDLIALFFVLFAASGFGLIARRLRNHLLGSLSMVLFMICVLELIFLARYKLHPVYPWVWTALELTA